MRKIAAFLIFLLAGAMVPAGIVKAEVTPVATFQVVAGQPWTKEIPGAIVNWTGEFDWNGKGWEATFSVYFTETGYQHGVSATENGFVDSDGKYIWIITNLQTQDNPETKELGLMESWHDLTVKFIDPLTGKVIIDNDFNGETYTLRVGDNIDVSGELPDSNGYEKTVLELKDIKTGLFGSKAVLVLHHITAVSGTVEVYPNPGYPPGTELGPGSENQTNEEPKIPPLNLSTPTAMIVVGENAAGTDVAAGAKVGIAVQKWIDIIKEKTGDVVIPGLGGLGAKLATLPSKNLNADAMLDTEVSDPGKIGMIVYSVGGPAANQYSAMLNNRTDLPVRFVKENDRWYLVSKYGDRWSGSYGVIMIIPAIRNVDEFKESLMKGNIKIADVLVAGLDRWGTYAACDLLKGEFLKPVKGIQPDKDLMSIVQLQAQVLAMFADPFSIFEIGFDPTKVPITAIIVDKDERIVKVFVG
ncbi:hypothetical protein A3L14_10980 [Thermococcus thioreducens]|uniref:S-layer protein C-terminal domain-containing protein n=2 Tax=Thermococcus thioreducens TaxID=277988 RepID=A0A0Q2MTY1_9EURY|nr:hypothetical protein A3L14_10980 [Thermococcus thioreducens]KQH83223.1 hypothetical protein AMR53_00630 [Thermococcus thioreducens]SEW23382.1 hypothetical protein SAMN05216170_2304 [Thermococcus thioreducens]